MDREQKQAAVTELSQSLGETETVFAVDYRGISVTQAAELRRRLAEADAVFKVVKNRLAKLAVAEAGTEGVDELLVGPTALTLVKGDAVIAAKAISSFTREHQVLAYKGGLMDGEPLDAEGFSAIARLPGLDQLHGQLVGLTASPLTGLATGLGSLLSGLAIALGQIAEQGLVSGEAPADDAGEAASPEEEPPSAPESDETAPRAEHAEEEAQPEEPDQPPADEPPAGSAETSEEENEQGEESSQESEE